MRIVIYGLGQIFERYKEYIDWKNVSALCDKNTEMGKSLQGVYDKSIISRETLCGLECDFVAIFSNTYFEEIKRELIGEYAVPKEKIISWREAVEYKREVADDILSFCRLYFKDKGYKKYLDIGMNVLPKNYLTKTELVLGNEIILDGILSEEAVSNENLYDHVYEDCNEVEDCYEVAILWQDPQYIEDSFRVICEHTRYIIFCMKRIDKFTIKSITDKLNKFGNVKCISKVEGDFWIIDTKYKNISKDVSIYVAIHKKYDINKEKPYIPLCVGGYQEKEYLTEQTGDNIAYLNSKINECTALYWIWKNTKSQYIGLNHYRRYFYNNEIESIDNYLDLDHINEIFKEYDIILPKVYPLKGITMLDQIRNSMNPELCQKGYSVIRKKIEQKQPDYLNAFDSVMDGYAIFNCNIFVTKREILDRYCEWLFSFLIEAAEEIDVEGYDSYSQRVIGFFAERMWTVWLRKNRLRIKELPYVIIR